MSVYTDGVEAAVRTVIDEQISLDNLKNNQAQQLASAEASYQAAIDDLADALRAPHNSSEAPPSLYIYRRFPVDIAKVPLSVDPVEAWLDISEIQATVLPSV